MIKKHNLKLVKPSDSKFNFNDEDYVDDFGYGNDFSLQNLSKSAEPFASFATELAKLNGNLSAFSNTEISKVILQDLGENLKFKNPYYVEVICEENSFTATLLDLNLYGNGDTEYEAVEMLKSEIFSLYYDLIDQDDSKLGKSLKKSKSFLKRNLILEK